MCLELDSESRPIIGKKMIESGHSVSRLVQPKDLAWYDFAADITYVDIGNLNFFHKLMKGFESNGLNTAF